MYCDAVAGSLRQISPEILGKNRKDSYNSVIYTEYTYTATTAMITIQNDPPDKKVIKWEFSGIPGSLIPGDSITITISGSLEIHTPFSGDSNNRSYDNISTERLRCCEYKKGGKVCN